MPDSEELEKKEKREFMRETIVKPPLTRKQIAKRVALFVCASAAFGGVAAVSFAAVKPFADRCFQGNGMQETSSVEFSKDDPDSVSPSDGADADMTAQPEQMEQEIDEAVSEALSSYQFSVDNFNSMTSVLRGIGELGDKSIVTVSSGKQDTDIFGNPVENTGDYAGAVIAESDGEFLIFTYADAVRAADSINVRFSDGTKNAGTVRQIDEVLGMAVVAVPSGNLPEEERKKVQVLSLANSYRTVHALRGISFTIYEGEFVTIMGTSGSGKSTLLNTLGCLDTPTSGEYLLDGVSVRTMSKPQRAVLRNRKIGFVFQNYNLLPKTTAVENVELPLMYNSSISASERRKRAIESLIAVGLGDRLEHKSNQMSGGQMQRVAIARALVNNPAVILADEATGNLDTRTSFEILVLFQKLHAEGRTLIFVTHNPEIAQYSSRNIRLRDGHVVEDTINPQILSAAAALAALPKNDED